ncbi:MAG: hypothetical protein WB783_17590 [Arenicellales bacterium]
MRQIHLMAVDLVFHSPRWLFNLTIGITATVVLVAISQLLFKRLPMMDDSVAALYQARIFAHGKLVWPVAETLKPWFDVFGVITPIGKPGVWAGMYPPGWSLALAFGVWLGVPWLVNPVLGGCLVVMICELGHELYDNVTARTAALLALFSPMAGVVSATHLSHTSAALSCMFAWWSVLRLQSTRRYFYAFLLGMSLAAGVLIRPQDALLVGIVIGIGVLVQFRRALALWRQLAVAVAIAGLGVVALLAFQYIASGAAGVFGHEIEMGAVSHLGFGRVGDSSYVYTPTKAIQHTLGRLEVLDWQLLGWPIPTLILLLTPFVLWRGGWREVWLLAPTLALSGLFFFYWYWEEWLPARYLFAAVPPLFILAARGGYLWHDSLRHVKYLSWLPAFIFMGGTVYSATVGMPEYHRFFQRNHGDVEHNLGAVMDAHDVTHALVFMRSTGKLPSNQRNDYYATGFMRNSLNLDGNIVFARDGSDRSVGKSDEELIKAFPGRSYYLYRYNQSTRRSKLFLLVAEHGHIVKKRKLGSYP